jgi:hypothetical protein
MNNLRNYYSSQYSGMPYYTGRSFAHRSGYYHSNYYRRSVHHSHRRNRRSQFAVRGIVVSTAGAANNGTVQIHMLPMSDTRFRYAKPKNGAALPNADHNYQVNTKTRYEIVVGNNGVGKNGNFAALQAGDPVIILTHHNPYKATPNNGNNGNNVAVNNQANGNGKMMNAGHAEFIEVFHKKAAKAVAAAN